MLLIVYLASLGMHLEVTKAKYWPSLSKQLKRHLNTWYGAALAASQPSTNHFEVASFPYRCPSFVCLLLPFLSDSDDYFQKATIMRQAYLSVCNPKCCVCLQFGCRRYARGVKAAAEYGGIPLS